MHHIPRLFVDDDLQPDTHLALNAAQSRYVSKVMRVRPGGELRLFNGRDGEWSGQMAIVSRRQVKVTLLRCIRAQQTCADVELAFAPVKRSRMEFIVEKATELGVSALHIVRTDHTSQKSVRSDRLSAISREAAEQSERLDLPEMLGETALAKWLGPFPPDRVLLFCDESGDGTAPILEALQAAPGRPVTVLIGPEGGFSRSERQQIRGHAAAVPVTLGPRILRADTAAIAALALVQAVGGDW